MDLTQQYRNGDTLYDAVQLTPANGADVWEWADSKPFYSPDNTVTGLTIYTTSGREKAEFGDWVVRDPYARFFPVKPDLFATAYTLVGPEVVHPDEMTGEGVLAAILANPEPLAWYETATNPVNKE